MISKLPIGVEIPLWEWGNYFTVMGRVARMPVFLSLTVSVALPGAVEA